MMQDLILTEALDLQIENGDLLIGKSHQQHQQLLLITAKGDWKENPTIGVGAAGYLKDQDINGLLGEVKKEFERDGMQVNTLAYLNGEIVVDAYY